MFRAKNFLRGAPEGLAKNPEIWQMADTSDRWRELLTRRRFLGRLGATAVGGALTPWTAFAAQGTRDLPRRSSLRAAEESKGRPPDFEVIPPSASGIKWVHDAALSPHMYMPESLGAGCGFFDYDNDGWPDIYLVNSGPCDFFTPKTPIRNALYRNNRDGSFTNVTEKAGVPGTAYGMGVATGDYDGDGFPDLFVAQYPRSVLYHNNGDGTFTDVTEKAGVAAPGWATSALWFDYDNDGRLDLFVCSFIKYDKAMDKYCGDTLTGVRHYCKPNVYSPSPCWLFHNNGDGTFTDVSKQAGIGLPAMSYTAVAADINNDGWMDLYVTNDTLPNYLFANRGKGRFEEIGLLAGVGYSVFGMARSGMGTDAADYDEDGWIDLFEENVDHEMFSLYNNNHNETFTDVAANGPIAAASRLLSGMAVKFLDYDNDGNLDALSVDGHPDTMIRRYLPEVHYREPLLLFRHNGQGYKNCYEDVSLESGPIFSQPIAGRGLALGDFDNDGSVDALVSLNNAAPILLRNNAGRRNHWLGVRLVGRKSNRDAVGAKVRYQAGPLLRHRSRIAGGSYMSCHEPRLVLGLGRQTKVDWLEVQWPQPGGGTERFTNVPIDRYITIVEGEGKWK